MGKESTDETKIAVIGANLEYIKKDIAEIKQSVKDLSGVYVTRAELDDFRNAIELRATALEKASNLWRFLSPILGATLGSIMTFLLINYLTR